jgi:prepilin-type N-terminal cleavage/methylation domain-containing protein
MPTFVKNTTTARRGFTLLELLVAVTITSIVIVALLSMTGVVVDAWRNGNNKIFTNNEARAAFNRLAEDLESAIIRDNIPQAEWFVAATNPTDFTGLPKPANATWLAFYTTPGDRQLFEYQAGTGNYDTSKPIPGNVVTVSYKIVPQDPISGKADYRLYGLYRAFPKGTGTPPNPAKITFDSILGKPGLMDNFWASRAEASDKDNFYISNIFDFSFTFWATYTDTAGKTTTVALPLGQEIHLTSEGLWVGAKPNPTATPTYPGGKLAAVDISMTILTQEGAQKARANDVPNNDLGTFAANPDNARTYSHKIYFAPEVQRVF